MRADKHTRLKDCRNANGRTYTLGQHDLVILGAQRSHHDSEDVEETSSQKKPAWAVVVVDHADDGTLEFT